MKSHWSLADRENLHVTTTELLRIYTNPASAEGKQKTDYKYQNLLGTL